MIIMHLYDKKKEEAVRKVAGNLKESVKAIGMSELDQTLMGLYSGKSSKHPVKIPPLYFMPELLIFAGMQEETLDAFLEQYKASGAEPIALKAITTPYNSDWTVYELIGELQKEHEKMSGKS